MKYKKFGPAPDPKEIVKQLPVVITADNEKNQKYPSLVVGEVWEKGKKEFGFFFFKRDIYGKIIAKHEYGKKTQYGWEIAHRIPLSEGGSDDVSNLIPVHWENAES